MNMNKYVYVITLFLICALICTGCLKKENNQKKDKPKIPDIKYTGNFNVDLIKLARRNENFLISPYSIEIALNMLKEGASGETRKQIESVIPDRNINDVSVKKRVNVANALFIKDKYKSKVKDKFKGILTGKYNSEVLYDEFKTPDVINNWVNEETDGMIKKILDNMDKDFVLGLANAIAIDVDWSFPFDCYNTKSEKFTNKDGKEVKVEMMHNTFDYKGFKYLKSDDATGIVIPYASYDKKTGENDADGSNLEFIGILPEDSVDKYINNLTEENLNKLLDSGKESSRDFEIKVSLPRFKYSYEIPNFMEILEEMGIKDAFSPDNANFTKIMDRENTDDNLYVSTAIHKTFIDLNENGTRAAAVTYFGIDKSAAAPSQPKSVKIKFNKPFVYMIRDSKSEEILFFGAVYEPNLWNGSTCPNN